MQACRSLYVTVTLYCTLLLLANHSTVLDARRLRNQRQCNGDALHDIGVISAADAEEVPPQWIRCDLRKLDFSMFNQKVKVIMADPPWDIHMDLPYGTMMDQEMLNLRVDVVQDEGVLFLWVTGRAMELGRLCLERWGYRRAEELVWVKTNQLQRIIRTGRTGHWINHSKEHCLVGIKGNPKLNRNIDCDVIVAEVRETSRKPDEIYRIIERMVPGPYKLELFGRQHNTRRNWITLGNQLNGVELHDTDLIAEYDKTAERLGLPLANSSASTESPSPGSSTTAPNGATAVAGGEPITNTHQKMGAQLTIAGTNSTGIQQQQHRHVSSYNRHVTAAQQQDSNNILSSLSAGQSSGAAAGSYSSSSAGSSTATVSPAAVSS